MPSATRAWVLYVLALPEAITTTERFAACRDHLLPGPCRNRHEPVDREAAEIGLSDARKIGRRDPGDVLRRAHRQFALIEHADDLRRQQGAELFPVSLLIAKIAEHVAAAANDVNVVAHFNISFNNVSLDQVDFRPAF
jgi:hypothetical protein